MSIIRVIKNKCTGIAPTQLFQKWKLIAGIMVTFNFGAAYAESAGNLEEVIVTGSHIKGVDIAGVLPVTSLNKEDIELIGAFDGEELLRSTGQSGVTDFNSSNQAGGINYARGDISSVNLRGIGTGNTLMLINGRRMALHPGFANVDGVPVVSPNMNSIPVAGIDRLDILRDGAGATYGADAVAGVVNNVINSDFEGMTLQARFGGESGTSRQDKSLKFQGGGLFNEGATHLTLFSDFSNRSAVEVAEYPQAASANMLSFVQGTPFEGDSDFDSRSSHSSWGNFTTLDNSNVYLEDGTKLTSSGNFHVQSEDIAGCLVDLGDGVCIDGSNPSSSKGDRAMYYDWAQSRQATPERNRFNLFTTLTHDLGSGQEVYGELGGYYARTARDSEAARVLETAAFVIPKTNYWNPFGAKTLADGSINPNRLAGLDSEDVPDEGLDLRVRKYRTADAGRRHGIVINKSYRFLAGIRGTWNNWDYDSALLYSESHSDDLIKNQISTTLLQQSLALNTPDAYNIFNGSGGSIAEDLTPNPDHVIQSILRDVTKKAETSLALVDLKLSNPSIFPVPAGDIAIAVGVEAREEAFRDDRGEAFDGTTPFVDLVTGEVSQSDALGSSPTSDTEGSRRVYSAFTELVVPVVSESMDIPFVNEFYVQLAARYENFSDTKNVLKPRVAAFWNVTPGLSIRGSWAEGFRAPNLVQVNDAGLSRINSVNDATRCTALVAAGEYDNLEACPSYKIERYSSGSKDLKPEESESLTFGIIYEPEFLPGLTLTTDYWEIEQNNLIGLFSLDNWAQLDLLARQAGWSHINVIRDEADEDDIVLYEGTGLTPAGRIQTIIDPYTNLNTRKVAGVDYGLKYEISLQDIGEFNFSFDAFNLLKFDQEAGGAGQDLLDLGFGIDGLGDLIRQDSKPKWRYSTRLNWKKDNWSAGLTGYYVGSVLDTGAKTSVDGETVQWRVDNWFKVNTKLAYSFKEGNLRGTRVTLGIKNVGDRMAPIADERYGYMHKLHSITGRYYYLDLKMKF